jgi:F-box interacting protein
VAGFFYDSEDGNRNFTSIVHGVRPRFLEFVPFNIENVAVSDCCNGLILCWCLGANGYRYVIYNPMTQKFKILPPSTHDVGHAVGEARLAFDPIAFSHFQVIEYVDVNAVCAGMEIYSSQTIAWIYEESEWGEHTDVTFYRQPSVFLNGCLYIMGHSREYPMILVCGYGGKHMEEN